MTTLSNSSEGGIIKLLFFDKPLHAETCILGKLILN